MDPEPWFPNPILINENYVYMLRGAEGLRCPEASGNGRTHWRLRRQHHHMIYIQESVFNKIRDELVGLKLGAEDDFLPFISAPPVELHGNLAPVQWWGLDGQRAVTKWRWISCPSRQCQMHRRERFLAEGGKFWG